MRTLPYEINTKVQVNLKSGSKEGVIVQRGLMGTAVVYEVEIAGHGKIKARHDCVIKVIS